MTAAALQATQRSALLRLLLGALCISLSGVFVKLVSVGPTTSGFYRVAIGSVLLCLIVWLRGKSILPSRASVLWIAGAGVAFGLDLFVWHKSIIYVGVGLSTLLGNFQVFVMAAVGVLIFGERMSPWQIVAIPLAVFGLYLIVGVDWNALEQTSKAGVVLGLMTALFYAATMLCLRQAKWASPDSDGAANLGLSAVVSAIVLAIIAAGTGETLKVSSLHDLGWLSAYALVAQVFGWLLITSALPHLSTVKVGLALLFQPTLAYVWDVVIFSRQLDFLEVLGAIIAMIAIYLGSRNSKA